ncbi:MAG: hypothetical protein ACREQ2_25100, partial [Candidatus Binatia bacterium]
TFLSSLTEMNAADSSDSSLAKVGHLNKRRNSSSTPLHYANQSYTYYERERYLDLDAQQLIFCLRICFENLD